MLSLIDHISTMKFLKHELGKVAKIKRARARTVPDVCLCYMKDVC